MMSQPSSTDSEQTEDQKKWYYSVEVENGVFTEGNDHPNLAITRHLLRSVTFRGYDCLDVGTQEAVVPILLKKGGANRVVAYDRRDLSDRVAHLQRTYDVAFEYIGGTQLTQLPTILDHKGGRFFDLVVFAGVLYHMVNPLGLLALVRGLCKVGGLFLIETSAIQAEQCHLVFNAKGELGPASNFFVPTTAWLDYVLRLLALRPISVSYLGRARNSSQLRVAVLCRSEAAACPLDKGDKWAFLPFHKRNFRNESQVEWDSLRKNSSTIDHRPLGGSTNGGIYDIIRQSPPYTVREDEVRLSLNSSM